MALVAALTFFSNMVVAQSGTISNFDLSIDRLAGSAGIIEIRGDSINLIGQYSLINLNAVCAPCTISQSINIGSTLSGTQIAATGIINGVYYSGLYIEHSLTYSGDQSFRIRRTWSKSIRHKIPARLTGTITIWARVQDAPDRTKALFYQDGVNLPGTVDLDLRWTADSGVRLFSDKRLRLSFTAAPATN